MPALRDLPIYRGRQFRRLIVVADRDKFPLDFTGCTAKLQFRSKQSPTANLLHECSLANGELSFAPANGGKILLLIAASVTALFAWNIGFYDLVVYYPSGADLPVIYGKVEVHPTVTV
jgi:hypothetical protein